MDKEVALSVQIAAAMILMSALIGIVIYTVQIGNEVKGASMEQAAQLEASLKTYSIDQLIYTNTVLPAAAAHAFIEKNYNIITEYECNICGSITPCLLRHLTGKVSMQVSKIVDSQYRITIHKENCPWDTSGCNE